MPPRTAPYESVVGTSDTEKLLREVIRRLSPEMAASMETNRPSSLDQQLVRTGYNDPFKGPGAEDARKSSRAALHKNGLNVSITKLQNGSRC